MYVSFEGYTAQTRILTKGSSRQNLASLKVLLRRENMGSRHLELFSLLVNDSCWGQKPKLPVNPQNLSTWIKKLWCIYGMEYFCCCSAAKSCPTICDPTDCRMPGLPVPHHLPEFAQVHVHYTGDTIQPSHHLMPSSLSALSLSQHRDFSNKSSFASDDQNTGASASGSVLPMNIQG